MLLTAHVLLGKNSSTCCQSGAGKGNKLLLLGEALCLCSLQVERLLPLCECVYTIKRFVETRSRIDHPKVAQVRP
jgi:hypothetical protein